MSVWWLTVLAYVVPVIALMIAYTVVGARRARRDSGRLQQAIADGLTEPPSLHPVVDPLKCVGSASCVSACPEDALGIIDGKAVLASPTACIGHGACAAACPLDAITLVFGTERRGVDIPQVTPEFESNVPGIFIAGELGGMGLIRKATEQGRQAVRSMAKRRFGNADYDVLIAGAGPAGIAAGLAAIENKLRYRLIEQEDGIGGSVYHYPRQKIAMTAPVDLPIVGAMHFFEVSKEKLLSFWNTIVGRVGLKVCANERLEALEQLSDGALSVRTTNGTYRVGSVLLAIGRRGTPRRLEVPGEDLSKVTYRLIDPDQYRGQHVLVVGGGDSAVEAALAVANAGAIATLAYRGAAFNRIKARNRQLISGELPAHLKVMLSTDVEKIEPESVTLRSDGGAVTLSNDAVIICAGGVLPTEFLRSIGIHVETKFGTA